MHPYQALVVDDEPSVRALTMRALSREGFQCMSAADGAEAGLLVSHNNFDAVVTDLRMPNKHGHALAVELLGRKQRPVIVVLTGVIEHRLAKDLMARGVDDIMFKPMDYTVFAAKVRALVDRRKAAAASGDAVPAQEVRRSTNGRGSEPLPRAPSHAPRNVKGIRSNAAAPCVPKNPTALEIFRMADSSNFDAKQITRVLADHEQLAQEIIQIANSRFYNRAGRPVSSLERAVVLMGQKRVGQLALAANAIAALAPRGPEGFDPGHVWRECVISALAVELLVESGRHHDVKEGLLLCASFYAVGHLLLAVTYPERHTALVALDERRSPVTLDGPPFPMAQSEAALELLSDWGIPEEQTTPLQDVDTPFLEMTDLQDPRCRRAALVKTAVLVARIALRRLAPWHSVDIPDASTIRQLRIQNPRELMTELEVNVQGLNSFLSSPLGTRGPVVKVQPEARLEYGMVRPQSCDLLSDILRAGGYSLVSPFLEGESIHRLVVNCLGVDAQEADAWLDAHRRTNALLVCDRPALAEFANIGEAIDLPAYFHNLRYSIGRG